MVCLLQRLDLLLLILDLQLLLERKQYLFDEEKCLLGVNLLGTAKLRVKEEALEF